MVAFWMRDRKETTVTLEVWAVGDSKKSKKTPPMTAFIETNVSRRERTTTSGTTAPTIRLVGAVMVCLCCYLMAPSQAFVIINERLSSRRPSPVIRLDTKSDHFPRFIHNIIPLTQKSRALIQRSVATHGTDADTDTNIDTDSPTQGQECSPPTTMMTTTKHLDDGERFQRVLDGCRGSHDVYDDDNNDNNNNNGNGNDDNQSRSRFNGFSPTPPLLELSNGRPCSTDPSVSERGIVATRDVVRGTVLFRVARSLCLSDDCPPAWLRSGGGPWPWYTRLAATVLDVWSVSSSSSSSETTTTTEEEEDPGTEWRRHWTSLWPDPGVLRRSLPVHWRDGALSSARCFALEVEADAAYFDRSEAVEALQTESVISSSSSSSLVSDDPDSDSTRSGFSTEHCHGALDLVQTRACRVDVAVYDENDGTTRTRPVRLLVPVFDFFNHDGRNPNAEYFLETDDGRDDFVVVATRDVREGEEITIDYGTNARPAWKCLASYGFVPDDDLYDNDRNVDDNDDDSDVAEVFWEGVRYEVGRNSVPVDLVEIVAATVEPTTSSSPPRLTPAVALKIAKRVSSVAYDLLYENAQLASSSSSSKPKESRTGIHNEDDKVDAQALALTAKLRYAQHRVLIACAMGLRNYAAQALGYGSGRDANQ